MAKPTPIQRRDFLNSYVDPYLQEIGNPNNIGGVDTTQPGQPSVNRALEISMKGDTDKIPRIGIMDIDEAIQYYFDNRLKLSVVQNNSQIAVPVIYGSPETWKSVQADGFYRDKEGKIMVPLIMYKKETIEQNRDLGNKLDGNVVNNVVMLKKKFSRRNVYDNFYLMTNQKPQEEWMLAIVPDYVTVRYTCTIFTDYVEQMNKLIEAINFASNSYWGDPERFQFKTRVESFNAQINLEAGADRAVKSTFSLILNGYLIPDSVNAEIAKMANKFHNFTKVIFNPELVTTKI
jgi:hypothetical protein